MRNLIIFGWLLVTHYGGTIAWYETEKDCAKAAEYISDTQVNCVPDRFSLSEAKP